jgi:hypothetical protein
MCARGGGGLKWWLGSKYFNFLGGWNKSPRLLTRWSEDSYIVISIKKKQMNDDSINKEAYGTCFVVVFHVRFIALFFYTGNSSIIWLGYF